MSRQDPFYDRPREPLLIVISGPSGVGKDSVLDELRRLDANLHFVVTATNRPPRPNEVDGRDYIFVSSSEFAHMIDENELLEYAIVYNDYKGIPKQQVRDALASGKDVIMRIDVQGAATIRALCPEALLIFIMTPDETTLIDRLNLRQTEAAADLQLRIATARREMARIGEFDYYVVNQHDELDTTVAQVLSIIQAEHQRVKPRRVTL